jgi:cation diffusion facilitator family transporter
MVRVPSAPTADHIRLMEMQQRKSRVAWLSVLSNVTLVVLKLIVGIAIMSVSVISEAIHSGMDLLAAVIALVAVKNAGVPPDRDHPYGHGKIENLSGTIEAFLIFVAALGIIWQAVLKLLGHGEELKDVGVGVAVMGVSMVANYIVSHMLFKVGKETDSMALQADAWHLRTDVWTSMGVMGGLAVIGVGERFLPSSINLHWIDPVTAIAVALLIIRAAWDLTRDAARDLMDASLPEAEERWINDYLKRLAPTVLGMHRLRTRKSGSSRFVEFHIQVEPAMTVADSHEITDRIGGDIAARFPGTTVTVHVEPCDLACIPACREGCLLTPEQQEARKAVVG